MRLYELTEAFESFDYEFGTNHPHYNDKKVVERHGHIYTFYKSGNMVFIIAISKRGNISFASTPATENEPDITDFDDAMKDFTGNIVSTFSAILSIIIDILSKNMHEHKTFFMSGKDRKRLILYKKMLKHPNILKRLEQSKLTIVGTIHDKIYIERDT